jgi:hypothetical protein
VEAFGPPGAWPPSLDFGLSPAGEDPLCEDGLGDEFDVVASELPVPPGAPETLEDLAGGLLP